MSHIIAALSGAGTDGVTFIAVGILGLVVPMVGLMISVASLQRPGGNMRSGIAMTMFFAFLMAGGLLMALEIKDAISEKPVFILRLLVVCGHGLAAVVATWGMWYSRRKRGKWQGGRRRESWSFWLNALAVIGYGIFFILEAFPRIMNMRPGSG